MKYMKYKIYSVNEDGKDEKIATTRFRPDADTVLTNYGFGYIKFGEKIIFTKGQRG